MTAKPYRPSDGVLPGFTRSGARQANTFQKEDLRSASAGGARDSSPSEHAEMMAKTQGDSEESRCLPAAYDAMPTRCLSHLQPGASPEFYGPDDVVIDGDWLSEFEMEFENTRHSIAQALDAIDGAHPGGAVAALAEVERILRPYRTLVAPPLR